MLVVGQFPQVAFVLEEPSNLIHFEFLTIVAHHSMALLLIVIPTKKNKIEAHKI